MKQHLNVINHVWIWDNTCVCVFNVRELRRKELISTVSISVYILVTVTDGVGMKWFTQATTLCCSCRGQLLPLLWFWAKKVLFSMEKECFLFVLGITLFGFLTGNLVGLYWRFVSMVEVWLQMKKIKKLNLDFRVYVNTSFISWYYNKCIYILEVKVKVFSK